MDFAFACALEVSDLAACHAGYPYRGAITNKANPQNKYYCSRSDSGLQYATLKTVRRKEGPIGDKAAMKSEWI